MTLWHPSRLTPAQLEERRLQAAKLVRAGHLSHAEIARRFGISRTTVGRWAAILTRRGLRGLRRRPHTGRRSRLTAARWRRVTWVPRRGAGAAGFDTERWTLRRIAVVIQRACGVRYHPASLSPLLRARGWTPQRPATHARERDDTLVEAWLKRDWPRITRGLAEPGASWPSWTKRVTRFGPA